MKTIIVDDEPKAIELLKSYAAHFEFIELTGTFRNALKGLEYLRTNPVDLIFLDINMPHLSGLSLAKMITPETMIIFTTAYSEYAVESYEIQAIDYLLKPISLERFTKAVYKALANVPGTVPEKKILIKSGANVFRVGPQNILFLEKKGNYMLYYLSDQKILARESVTEAVKKLPSSFLQIHRSYIVNSSWIDSFDRKGIIIKGKCIPIGSSFKEEFFKQFNIK